MTWVVAAIVVLFILRLLVKGKIEKVKGAAGEMKAALYLEVFAKSDGYHRHENLLLPDGKGGTTEIDAVMFSPYGIFVFEVKHYSGWIFGDAKSKKWMQTFRRSRHQFQNPLHQNYKHIAALREITNLDEAYFRSIVVFTGKAEFKREMPDNVVYARNLRDKVSAYEEKILTDQQVNDAVAAVLKAAKTDLGSRKKHIDDLRKRHK